MSDTEQNGTWAATRLSTIARVIRGRVKPQDHPELPFVGMDNIEAHTMRLLGTVPASTMKSASVHFQPGDLLYGRLRPYLNKVYAPGFEGLASAEFIPLTPPQGVIPQFLQYRINAADFVAYASRLNEGDRPRVDYDQIGAFEIELPPSGEQRRIVEAIESYFTRLDDAVATLERVQRNLKRYRASVLNAAVEGQLVPTEAELARAEGRDYEPASVLLERILAERRHRWEEAYLAKMKAKGRTPKDDKWRSKYKEPTAPDIIDSPELPEGWTWATVDQLSHDVRYGSSAKADPDLASGVPVLRMGNIADGAISFADLKYLPARHPEFPDLLLETGDLLFNRTNSAELVGKTAVFRGYAAPCSLASYLIRVRMLSGVEPEYVAMYINSLLGRSWIASVVSQQVGQANVNGTKLKACLVPLPPAHEQTRIVRESEVQLSLISQLAVELQNSRLRCERLRQSILKWAFEGRLVDQDPSDEPASRLLERIRSEREATDDNPRRSPRRTKARSPKV